METAAPPKFWSKGSTVSFEEERDLFITGLKKLLFCPN